MDRAVQIIRRIAYFVFFWFMLCAVELKLGVIVYAYGALTVSGNLLFLLFLNVIVSIDLSKAADVLGPAKKRR